MEKSLYLQDKKRQQKETWLRYLVSLAALLTMAVLGTILLFLFIKGIGHINWHFLKSDFENKSHLLTIKVEKHEMDYKGLGLELEEIELEGKKQWQIIAIDRNSPLQHAKRQIIVKNQEGKSVYQYQPFVIKKGMILQSVNGQELMGRETNWLKEVQALKYQIRLMEKGGGIFPMLITTLIIILISIAIATPIGVFAAIYLNEYAKPSRWVRLIRFCIEALAAIPSIIYGLFGMLFFVTGLKMGLSVLAGALTLSIILLPILIRQTEESLKTVPMSFREAALGLGATKLQTILKVVLPSALRGIVVAIILSIGRVVGESAALLLTAGTTARIPQSLWQSGASLTIKAYAVAKEQGNYELASAIGLVLIIMVGLINISTKFLVRTIRGRN